MFAYLVHCVTIKFHDGGMGQLVEVVLELVREGQGLRRQYTFHHPLTYHVTRYIAHHCSVGHASDDQNVKS